MSGPRRDKEYLVDVHEAMRRIVEYTAGISYQEFLDDTKTQDAVIRNVQVMGEAALPTLILQLSAILVESDS